jgi:hypothetical protein
MEIKIKKTKQVKNKDDVHVRTILTVTVDGEEMQVVVPPGLTDSTKIKEYLENFLSGDWRVKAAEEYKELQEKALKAASKR